MDDAFAMVTERLALRHFTLEDGAMILELLNDPAWIRYIGDGNARTLDDARGYLEKIRSSYEQNGFGLYLVEARDTREPLGMCGIVKRDTLPGPDLGFAFLERHRSRGYALEAARATLAHARALGIERLLAIAKVDNERSARLLEKLGFAREAGETWSLNSAPGAAI
jgi:[ribosomal protein S5]-alanine N-acetyltransferase